SPSSSLAPLATCGCAVKAGSLATNTTALTTRVTRSRSAAASLTAATAFSAAMRAHCQACSGDTVPPTLPVAIKDPSCIGNWPAVKINDPVCTVGTYAATGATTSGTVNPMSDNRASTEAIRWFPSYSCAGRLEYATRFSGSIPGTICTSSQPSLPKLSRICLVECTRTGAVKYSHLVIVRPYRHRHGTPKPMRLVGPLSCAKTQHDVGCPRGYRNEPAHRARNGRHRQSPRGRVGRGGTRLAGSESAALRSRGTARYSPTFRCLAAVVPRAANCHRIRRRRGLWAGDRPACRA